MTNHWVAPFDTAPIEVQAPATTELPIWAGRPPLTVVPVYRDRTVDWLFWLGILATVLVLAGAITVWLAS